MMVDILQNIFGGGTPDNYQQRAQQYQQGAQGGNLGGLSDQDVAQRYQRTVQYAPPDVLEQAHAEAFNRLPPEQQPFQYPGFNNPQQGYGPQQMGQMARQAQQQQPDLLQQVLGPGGALSNPLAKMAMAGVAAAVAGKLMGAPGSGGGLLGGLGGRR
jgi:hypothetical protein